MSGVSYPRSRHIGVDMKPVAVNVTLQYPGYTYQYGTENRYLFDEYSSILDGTGKRSESHPCLHTKTEAHLNRLTSFDMTPGMVSWTKTTASPYWVPRETAQWIRATNVRTWLDNTSYERGTPRWSQFLSSAFQSFTEQVPTVIDVPHLLQDVLTLKGLVKQCIQVVKRVWKFLPKLVPHIGGRALNLMSLRAVIKEMSNDYLLYKFGIKPLMQEVEQFAHGVVGILKRLDFLRRTQGSCFSCKYSESITYTGVDQMLGTADNRGLGSALLMLREIEGTIRYTATARVQNNLIGLDGFLSNIRYSIGALGGKDVVKFLWDLVPFSFVVDWFYNIGELCDRYAQINSFKGSLDVKRCDTSFKKRAIGRLYIEGDVLKERKIDYGYVKYEVYDRQPSFDCAIGLLLPSTGLTLNQAGILSGLIGQRL